MNPSRRRTAHHTTALMVAFLAATAVLLAPLATTPLRWQTQAAAGACLLVVAWIVNRTVRAQWATYFLMCMTLVCTGRYAYWRSTQTLGLGSPTSSWVDIAFTLLVFSAELYAWVVLTLGLIQTARPLHRKAVALPSDPREWPSVDVYIPTYNEPLDVVRATVVAALRLEWPADKLAVFVLDDGVRKEFREFALSVGAGYITRREHVHAKAGNLNHALAKTHGEYIAIFDCDHVPTRAFLQTTMGSFLTDTNLALVQTPHHFYSPDPFERNLGVFRRVPNEGELFYGVVQDGNDLWNATFFCGSCAIMRRRALDEVGGIASETVTEDAHTALKLHRLGWNSAYLNVKIAAGLATESFSAHVGQRIRWARGMAQIARVDNPILGHGLTFPQRLCYFNAMLHFFFALPRLIFLTAPLLYLFFGVHVMDAYAYAIAAYAIPHLAVATMVNSRIQGRHRYSFWNEVYETALAPFILLPTLLVLISPKLGKFNVTAKGGLVKKAYFDARTARPFLVLFALNVAGVIAGAIRWWIMPSVDQPAILLTGLWTLYNLVLVAVVLGVNWEHRQMRRHARVPARMPAIVCLADGTRVPGYTRDISETGVRVEADAGLLANATATHVGIAVHGGKHDFFAAHVVGTREGVMRLEFEDLSAAQYARLVDAVYGRANSWLHWDDERRPDRPLRSLYVIGKLALLGVARALQGVTRHKPAPLADPAPDQHAKPAKVAAAATIAAALLVAMSCMAIPGVTRAAQATGPSPTHSRSTFTRTATLQSLGRTKAIRLRGTQGVQGITLSIPPNKVVTDASVDLRYHLSPGLLPRVSQLNVLVDGRVLKSIPVANGNNDGLEHTAAFDIPPQLFQVFNHIGFQLIGHYTEQCEDPLNSTLWATVSPDTTIKVHGVRLALHPDLSLLPEPFFYAATQSRLTVPFVLAQAPARDTLRAAGVLASWFGAMSSYRGTNFPVSTGTIPATGNAVVVAVASRLPAGANIPPVTGATVAITKNPRDPYGEVLWVTGTTPAEVLTAARAVAMASSLLQGSSAAITDLTLPPPPKPDHAKRWVPSHGAVQLAALAPPGPMSASGVYNTISYTMHMAPSLFLWQRDGVPLRLHYGYTSAAIESDSTLGVTLNGEVVRSLRLPRNAGAKEQRWLNVELPASALQAGSNRLDANFYLAPLRNKCALADAGNSASAVYPDSTIDLSGIPHYARIPDLAIWANGGYPFTRYADLSRTAIVLPDTPSEHSLSVYLVLMGWFGRQTGQPALRVAVATPQDVSSVADRNLVVLTDADHQPNLGSLTAAMPLSYKAGRVAVSSMTGWLGNLREHIPWAKRPPRKYSRRALGKLVADGAHPSLVIQESESPLHKDRAILLVSAGGALGWTHLRSLLNDAKHQQNVFGDVTVFHDGQVNSYLLHTPSYHVGHLPAWTWIEYWLQQYVWALIVLAIALSILIGVVANVLLRKRAQARAKGA